MSRIRGKDTKPEMLLRKALWKNGLRYQLKYKIFGKPDIIFPGNKIAVFVDGCFWHGCPDHLVKPKTNKKFWNNKIKKNIKRDKDVTARLTEEGWTVVRFWEHQITSDLTGCVSKVAVLCR